MAVPPSATKRELHAAGARVSSKTPKTSVRRVVVSGGPVSASRLRPPVPTTNCVIPPRVSLVPSWPRWMGSAERYSAGVVLFEMATGVLPVAVGAHAARMLVIE